MSGFSADWLTLREPADHAARNAPLARAAAGLLAEAGPARILDLGCGTGSNFRGFSPLVSAPQQWTLVDYDRELLDAARAALATWPGRKPANVAMFQRVDLKREFDALLSAPCDLVTAAAFFDLVSAEWIERFCAGLAARRLPLYAVLTYDGVERWRPTHALDAEILAAVTAHQATDKGFGPAAGPKAYQILATCLVKHGYSVREGASPWRLDSASHALITQLADGLAAAARATGRVGAAQAESWRLARRAAEGCEIGHMDLLAVPG